MKQCPQCNTTKLSEFNKCTKSKDKLQSLCRVCNSIAHKHWYNENKTYYKEKARAYDKIYYERVDAFLNAYKSTTPCTDCKQSYNSWVMDFDHLDPATKEDNVSDLRQRKISLKRIKTEIAKCELVCSNCHRERTHKRLCTG